LKKRRDRVERRVAEDGIRIRPNIKVVSHHSEVDWRGAGPCFLARDKERSLIKPQGAKVPTYWSRC
jgi:hypothetical protein